MTKNEVMQMALDVFTNKRYAHASAVRSASVVSLIDALALAKVTEANKELRAALAQPEKEWVGLTDENIFAVLENLQEMYNRPPTTDSRVIFARAIEAKLKEKNT